MENDFISFSKNAKAEVTEPARFPDSTSGADAGVLAVDPTTFLMVTILVGVGVGSIISFSVKTATGWSVLKPDIESEAFDIYNFSSFLFLIIGIVAILCGLVLCFGSNGWTGLVSGTGAGVLLGITYAMIARARTKARGIFI